MQRRSGCAHGENVNGETFLEYNYSYYGDGLPKRRLGDRNSKGKGEEGDPG